MADLKENRLQQLIEPTRGKADILVVEDDDVQAEAVVRSLRKAGVDSTIVVAPEGWEALSILRGTHSKHRIRRPYVVLLDLNLPRMGGFEVLGALRGDADPRLRRLPVVVFTTSGNTEDVHTAYELHASSFVTKPTGFERYLETVRAFREFWLRVATLPAGA
jgi:CheY-like chemotaxis protein